MAIPNHNTMATAPQFVGRDLGASDWVAVDQDRIDAFAACTGDRQWIHVDVERARRESPFGGADRAWLPHPVAGRGDGDGARRDSAGCRDRAQLWAGQGPLHRTGQGGRARAHAREPRSRPKPQSGGRMLLKLKCTLEIEGETKPALVAELLCMLIGKGDAAA